MTAAPKTMITRLAGTSLVLVGVTIFCVVLISDEPRFADRRLDFSEASRAEIALIMTSVVLVVSCWLCGLLGAARRGRWGMAVGIFFFWPLAYVYLLTGSDAARDV